MAGGFYDIAQLTFMWLQAHKVACPACRTLAVDAEMRTLEVEAETRTLTPTC